MQSSHKVETEYEINLLALKNLALKLGRNYYIRVIFSTEGQKATQETIGIDWGGIKERKMVDMRENIIIQPRIILFRFPMHPPEV
jgi:hypothetical protein